MQCDYVHNTTTIYFPCSSFFTLWAELLASDHHPGTIITLLEEYIPLGEGVHSKYKSILLLFLSATMIASKSYERSEMKADIF